MRTALLWAPWNNAFGSWVQIVTQNTKWFQFWPPNGSSCGLLLFLSSSLFFFFLPFGPWLQRFNLFWGLGEKKPLFLNSMFLSTLALHKFFMWPMCGEEKRRLWRNWRNCCSSQVLSEALLLEPSWVLLIPLTWIIGISKEALQKWLLLSTKWEFVLYLVVKFIWPFSSCPFLLSSLRKEIHLSCRSAGT